MADHIALGSGKGGNGKFICYIHKAIMKYGMENFRFDVVCKCDTESDAVDKEKFYIKQFLSNNSNKGYNLTEGGDTGKVNAMSIIKKIESSHKTPIAKYDLKGNLLKTYESVKAAARGESLRDSDLHRSHKKRIPLWRFSL